jgi:hypothetical protein
MKFTTQAAGELKQPENCDLIHETTVLKAVHALQSVCVMEPKTIHVPRTEHLFFTEEQVFQANTDSLNKGSENRSQEQTVWPTPAQLIDRLKSDFVMQHDIVVMSSASTADIALIMILVYAWTGRCLSHL